ncbi:MAG: helix-turn-helix transcriptional regulator [Crocinitomicaceae bacterium]
MKKWRELKKGENHHGSLILSGNIGIVFMATMPITDIFDRSLDQVLNISLVSISLFVTLYAYVKNFLYQSRLEYQFLNKIGFLEEANQTDFSYKKVLLKYNLTARELDVGLLVLEGKTYREIGDHMYVNHKTVSKHASNIFRKTNCANKTEFIELFTITLPR